MTTNTPKQAGEQMRVYSAVATDGYGFDAWVTQDGETIGDSWAEDEVEARNSAIKDAQFTLECTS